MTYSKKSLGETLIQNIKENDKASIIAAYFTIYGFHKLKNELSKIDNLNLILSSGLFNSEGRQLFSKEKFRVLKRNNGIRCIDKNGF